MAVKVDLEVNAIYECPECNYQTNNADEIIRHLVEVRGEDEEKMWNKIVDSIYFQLSLMADDFYIEKKGW